MTVDVGTPSDDGKGCPRVDCMDVSDVPCLQVHNMQTCADELACGVHSENRHSILGHRTRERKPPQVV